MPFAQIVENSLELDPQCIAKPQFRKYIVEIALVLKAYGFREPSIGSRKGMWNKEGDQGYCLVVV